MATWSQSHFLQALGWATLNSLWQMAFLWCIFTGANHVLKLSATRKYQAAVGAILLGFVWFVTTLIVYYQNNSTTYAFFENTIAHSNSLLHICLLSASLTYLLLLIFPAVRLLKNWQFVQRIKKEGQRKAQFEYRLFVQRIAGHLGITKKVKLFVSELVSSPVTIGYLKPIILLPVAAMNHLSTAQVEAILLHELSHIRRYDYLMNLVVSIIYTLLYFNPFVKAFMNTIEAEREACCDELVLQFGYDKVGYASALLHLEKNSRQYQALALAAAGKQNLLTRIEKIVGMEKKKSFKLIQIVPLLLAMVCVLLFNSVLIIQDAKSGEGIAYASDAVFTPWQWNNGSSHQTIRPATNCEKLLSKHNANEVVSSGVKIDIFQDMPPQPQQLAPSEEMANMVDHLMPVNFDDVDGRLSNEEKENVKTTIEATKKIASTLQWKEIETSIGEVMNQREKEIARQEYLNEINKIPWNNIAQNIKANYDRYNWNVINKNVDEAMIEVKIDSLKNVYSQVLSELEKSQKCMQAKPVVTPIPDASVEEIQQAKECLKKNLDCLRAATRPKKTVRL